MFKQKGSKIILLATSFLLLLVLCSLFIQENKIKEKEDPFIVRTTEHYVNKNEKATFTIVEYFDFDCVFCKNLHKKQLQEPIDYSGVNYIIRSYPIKNKERSAYLSIFAECLYNQNGDAGYIAFLEKYFEVSEKTLEYEESLKIAEKIAKNGTLFNSCIKNPAEIKGKLNANFLADNLTEIQVTPTFLVYKDGFLVKRYSNINFNLYRTLVSYYSKTF